MPLGLDSHVGHALLTMQEARRAFQHGAALEVAMQRNTERVEETVRSAAAQIEGSMASGLAEVQQQVGGLQLQIEGLHAELQRVVAAVQQAAAVRCDDSARQEQARLQAEQSVLNQQIEELVRQRDRMSQMLGQVGAA